MKLLHNFQNSDLSNSCALIGPANVPAPLPTPTKIVIILGVTGQVKWTPVGANLLSQLGQLGHFYLVHPTGRGVQFPCCPPAGDQKLFAPHLSHVLPYIIRLSRAARIFFDNCLLETRFFVQDRVVNTGAWTGALVPGPD